MDSRLATVFVVDDDDAVRCSLVRLIRAGGWEAEAYASARAFLERPPFSGTGCILLDVRMPGLSGPEFQESMSPLGLTLPVVFLTGYGDLVTGIRAMKLGAVDYLLKPADDEALFSAITRAVERHAQAQVRQREEHEIALRLGRLSAREREVMELVIRGRLNKQIAAELGIAEKTVKVHRARVMEKMEVRSVAELVHLWETAGLAREGTESGCAEIAPNGSHFPFCQP